MEELIEQLATLAVIFILMMILKNVIKSVIKPQSNAPEKPDCPPHKWTYGLDDQMFCNTCKKRPGEILSSYDKPY